MNEIEQAIRDAQGALISTMKTLTSTAQQTGIAIGQAQKGEEARVEIERLNKTLETRDAEIDALKAQVAELEGQVAALRADLVDARAAAPDEAEAPTGSDTPPPEAKAETDLKLVEPVEEPRGSRERTAKSA